MGPRIGFSGPAWKDEMTAAAETIRRISGIWRKAIGRVERRIEVYVGSLLFYLPGSGSMELWSGRISRELLKAFASGRRQAECKNHEIPRAVGARELLMSPPRTGAALARLWLKRYGVYSLVTKAENQRRKWGADRQFISPAKANRAAGIELIPITRFELARIRRGSWMTILRVQNRPTRYWRPRVPAPTTPPPNKERSDERE